MYGDGTKFTVRTTHHVKFDSRCLQLAWSCVAKYPVTEKDRLTASFDRAHHTHLALLSDRDFV